MNYKIFPLILLMLLATACKKDSHPAPSVTANDFVWKAMNLWYFWQKDVPDLADDRFSNNAAYESFINSKNTDNLFYNLLYDFGNTDRFSWIVDDYHDLDNQFAGINKTTGMSYGLVYAGPNTNKIFGYVRYVLPNSPADAKNIKRGDIFTRINGTYLDDSNYLELLGKNTAPYGMGYVQNGQVFDLQEEVTLTKVEMQENPVLLTKVFEYGGNKIGYLVYNGFRANFNVELNQAIGNLKAQGINNLILDLRYNGGGSVNTALYLGGMITGEYTGQVFTKLTFNEKTSNNNQILNFTDEGKAYNDDLEETGTFSINHLNMPKLVVIASGSTASASEMIINCLRPYIDVDVVGTKTYGKTVGSITLYDSPSSYYTSKENINTSHTWAMQPIVFDYKNSNNESGPTQGFNPMAEVSEISYLENLYELGNSNEPLLSAAINVVLGSAPLHSGGIYTDFKSFKDSQSLQRFGTEMYLDNGFNLIP